MDTSLLLELERAWLSTQLDKQSSPSPSPSPSQPPLPPWDAWPISSSLDSTSWPALQSELASLSETSADGGLPTSSSSSDSSSGAACSPFQGSSSGSPWIPDQGHAQTMAATEPPPAASSPCPATDYELMDPVMEFISDMLIMEEQMADRKCMRQECTAHQAIVSGFDQVLGDDSSPPSSYCTEQSSAGHGLDPFKDQPGTDDYSWIDEILAKNPFQEENAGARAWPLDHTSTVFNGLEQDPKLWPWPLEPSSSSSSDQDPKVWSLDSSSSGSHDSQDSSYGLLQHSYGVFPTSAMVPPDNYTSPPMQAILHNDAMPSQADLVSGNGLFFVEGPSQPPPVLKPRFRDFRKVRSEELPSNMTGGNDLLSFQMQDGFKRAVSDKLLEERKQPQPCDAPSKVVEDQQLSFVNNEDLNAEKNAKIYGDWSPENDDCIAKMRQARGVNTKRKGRPEPVDLRALLVNCAEALASNNLRKAKDIVEELQQHASQHGSAEQRLAHYFTEALVARLSGTGARLYTAMANNRPSAADMVKAFRLMMEVCPCAKLLHFYANHSILKAAEGASRVHIVDYGIFYGVQWPCLISALAERKGGPPFLRITGIDFPQPGVNPAERIEATGRRLAEYARAYNVPFQYHAIARKWEEIQPADLKLKKGEILVVNCIHRLRHLMDETVVTPSPRLKVLSRIHSLNPNMVLIAVLNAAYCAPFFLTRFREALYYFSSKFDMVDTIVADSENLQRLMIEREYFGREILNVVACEGPERVERPETYRQWQAHFQRAGFEPISLSRPVLSKARDVLKAYHKDFSVDDDSKWMLLGWKGRIFEGFSAWKPSATPIAI